MNQSNQQLFLKVRFLSPVNNSLILTNLYCTCDSFNSRFVYCFGTWWPELSWNQQRPLPPHVHVFLACWLTEPPHAKTNKMSVCPAKTQINLGIRPVWSVSLLHAQWVAKDLNCLHADSKDSGQTGRMPRLIWIFAGRTLILLVLSCRGSLSLPFH